MGVSNIDNVLMILGVSRLMTEKEREITTREMIRGFNDSCIDANTKVTGGQSVMNPWPMIGGTAISTVETKNIIFPNNAMPGDKLVLTKPLGTQVVVTAVDWLRKHSEKYDLTLKENITESDIWDMNSKALESMSRLNKRGAELMIKYNAHAATDITGFGFKGHLLNLVNAQKKNVTFNINCLPVIKNTEKIDKVIQNFKLIDGFSPETSGGLLISLSSIDADKLVKEMIDNNEYAWIVGDVKESNDKNVIFENDLKLELL